MSGTYHFLLQYGYLLLFGVVLAEQVGLPIPATPILLAAGALAGIGKMGIVAVMAISIAACLIGDALWFGLGAKRGSSILRLLCKISLEPDSCVKQTEVSYSRYGSTSLLFAKFVPGLSTIAPPMAGIFRLPLWRFLLLDAIGATLWSGLFVFAGWLFRTQLEVLAEHVSRYGLLILIALVFAFAGYIAYKYAQRHRVLKKLRIARITPNELKERMDRGERFTIIDLRQSLEWSAGKVPGAILMEKDQIETEVPLMAGDGEVILYCSCPNEVTAARFALALKRQGMERVRPLKGGFEQWRDLGFPVEV